MHSLILCLFLSISISVIQSALIPSQSQTQPVLSQSQPSQNLLRVDNSFTQTSTNIVQCLSYSGFRCTLCRAGCVLTNGKCYELIPNCLVQYTNVCANCQQGYRPVSSLVNSQKPLSDYVVTCVPVQQSTPSINSSTSTTNSTLLNPLIVLGRQDFILWTSIEVRHPTDIYMVIIWNFLDGNEDTSVKVKIQQCTLQSAVQGRVKDSTDKLTLISWILQNQLTNFVEGFIIDINNLYFYRLRYKSRITQTQYQVLCIVHEINFQVTLLQHLVVGSPGSALNGTVGADSVLTESEVVRTLRQQVMDLKLEASRQKQLSKQRQLQLLIFNQFSLISTTAVQTDPGCVIIKSYLDNRFSQFIKLLNIGSTTNGLYSWMNFQLRNVYFRKTDSISKDYLYEISFTDDAMVLVQFTLGRLYDIQAIKVVYNR